MPFLGFGKKKEPTAPQQVRPVKVTTSTPTIDTKTARFLVLGACCKKSADTFANVKQAVTELGYPDTVINIGDALEIAKYGVMQTPALVINNKVVSYGRLIQVEDAKKLIQAAGLQK